MSTIPVSLTEKRFNEHVLPYNRTRILADLADFR